MPFLDRAKNEREIVALVILIGWSRAVCKKMGEIRNLSAAVGVKILADPVGARD